MCSHISTPRVNKCASKHPRYCKILLVIIHSLYLDTKVIRFLSELELPPLSHLLFFSATLDYFSALLGRLFPPYKQPLPVPTDASEDAILFKRQHEQQQQLQGDNR